MRWIVFVLVGLLTTASLTEAATNTITTTVEQDKALGDLRRELNKDRKIPLTPPEFWDYLVQQWLDSLTAKARSDTQDEIRDAYQKASTVTQDEVKAKLGITP